MDELPEAEVVVLPLVVAEIETDAVCDEDTERDAPVDSGAVADTLADKLELDEPETDAESERIRMSFATHLMMRPWIPTLWQTTQLCSVWSIARSLKRAKPRQRLSQLLSSKQKRLLQSKLKLSQPNWRQ
jgi:hypothetical protein